MAEADFSSVLNVIRNAKQQPVNSASRRAAIQEAERFLNERKGKLRPEEEKQIREARREARAPSRGRLREQAASMGRAKDSGVSSAAHDS